MTREPDRIDIRLVYFAMSNANKNRGGYSPVYEHNGKLKGEPYSRGFDEDEAIARAKALAEEEAAHYAGDWNVTIKKGPTQLDEADALRAMKNAAAHERHARRVAKYPGNKHSTGKPRAGGRGDI